MITTSIIVPALFLISMIIVLNKLEMTLSIFKRGERVKIVSDGEDPRKTYIIKKISKYHNETALYILESEDNLVSQLYYETNSSCLERIEDVKVV